MRTFENRFDVQKLQDNQENLIGHILQIKMICVIYFTFVHLLQDFFFIEDITPYENKVVAQCTYLTKMSHPNARILHTKMQPFRGKLVTIVMPSSKHFKPGTYRKD